MKFHTALVLTIFCTALSACNGKDKSAATVRPPVAVDAKTVAAAPLVEGVDVTGSLEPKFWADVKTQIPGLLKEVYVTEWVRVHKGQKLARIDIAETEALVKRAEAALESARANKAQVQVSATRAEREFARMQKLKESGLATQQALDDARSETEASTARIEAAKAQIRASEEELRQARARLNKGMVISPLDGVVAQRNANVGDLASDAAAGAPIFRIVDNRLLNLTVTVPSQSAAQVKTGQPLEFSVDSLPSKTFKGTVMYVNPELSSSDRSLKVIAEVRNQGDLLKGGLFAKGRIVTRTRSEVVQIPRSALASWDSSGGKGTLFVITGDSVKNRPVTTGEISGDLVEITSGVAAGERYVSRGGFNLKDGDKVQVSGGTK
ncbi:MAG TPA: efflux RND transporter periplasmic adaptor subunit [Desulfuromonadales bacterium]|nr:efflux RND transporter periplasmic adaptor subunit [Desulfuromonadales bacterium]